mgnify:CR=1 FL=1
MAVARANVRARALLVVPSFRDVNDMEALRSQVLNLQSQPPDSPQAINLIADARLKVKALEERLETVQHDIQVATQTILNLRVENTKLQT